MSEEKTIKTAIENMNTYLDECHYDGDTVTITAKVLRSIRDNYCELLRCKKAIERLEGYNQNLLAANVGLSCGMLDEIKAAKSEAIKEFWKRLREKAYKIHGFEVIDVEDSDNLAKEMVGDE